MDATIRVAEVPASRGVAWLGEPFTRPLRAWLGASWLSLIVAALVLRSPCFSASARQNGEAAAFDSADAPAFNTSAQAVPSGYFRIPCC